MAMQQQQSSFAAKLGQRLTQAHLEHKDKPIEVGMMRLPPNIHNGIARLQTMITKEYPDDKNGPGTKGQTFFRAAAVAVYPDKLGDRKVAGCQTAIVIPICDIPAKGMRKAVSLSENWNTFQNLFKMLSNGAIVCHETDPYRIEAYYQAAMKALTDPNRPGGPIYISFTTRGWTPPPNPINPKPEEIVFETWHGLAKWTVPDPSKGVVVVSNGQVTQQTNQQPVPNTPTTDNTAPDGLHNNDTQIQSQPPELTEEELHDEITYLVAICVDDPEGKTEEGAAAGERLEDLAITAGWSRDQVMTAEGWEAVGEMAMWGPEGMKIDSPTSSEDIPVKVGTRFQFCKRDKQGEKLTNKNGVLPSVEVEVTSVDEATQTCTVRVTETGKELYDLRTRKPVQVKFEWLE